MLFHSSFLQTCLHSFLWLTDRYYVACNMFSIFLYPLICWLMGSWGNNLTVVNSVIASSGVGIFILILFSSDTITWHLYLHVFSSLTFLSQHMKRWIPWWHFHMCDVNALCFQSSLAMLFSYFSGLKSAPFSYYSVALFRVVPEQSLCWLL